MKKNLISIVILALLIVNVVLSSVTLISVTGTNKKTAALVGDIAAAIGFKFTTTGDTICDEQHPKQFLCQML